MTIYRYQLPSAFGTAFAHAEVVPTVEALIKEGMFPEEASEVLPEVIKHYKHSLPWVVRNRLFPDPRPFKQFWDEANAEAQQRKTAIAKSIARHKRRGK